MPGEYSASVSGRVAERILERGGGAFGIGWRRKTRRKGIWEDPEVGFRCGAAAEEF